MPEYFAKSFKFFDAFISLAASSEFVSSSIPSWRILTAHAQPFRGARDLASCLKVPLDSLLVWASSGGSGETARMRRLAWTFAARIGDKYQIRLTRPSWLSLQGLLPIAMILDRIKTSWEPVELLCLCNRTRLQRSVNAFPDFAKLSRLYRILSYKLEICVSYLLREQFNIAW